MILIRDVENIVYEGGAMRGIALLGIIKFLEEKNMLHKIKRVIGSSAGSLYAVLTSLRVSFADAYDIVKNFDFTKLQDDSKYLGYVGDAYHVYRDYAMCEGEQLSLFYQMLLEKFAGNKNITFSDLFAKTGVELTITGTNISLMKECYFNHLTEPDMEVWKACRISSSIPFFFKSLEYKGCLYVDGGVLNNYPIWYFDTHNSRSGIVSDDKNITFENLLEDYYKIKTIGFKLVSSDEKMGNNLEEKIEYTKRDIKTVKDFILTLADTMTLQIERSQIHKDYFKHSVCIQTENVSSTDFTIGIEVKDMLIKNGYDACKKNLTT